MQAVCSEVTAAALPEIKRRVGPALTEIKRRVGPALKAAGFALLLALGAGRASAAPGDLDSSFSSDGKTSTAFFTEAQASAAVHAIAFQTDGKIVAAGTASRAQEAGAGTGSEFALARYNPDGSLDTSFSGDGRVTTDIAGGQDYAHDVAMQPDGKIVAVGSATLNAASFFTRFTLVRYTASGALDASFGSGGIVSTDFFGTDNVARAVALQSDGKIVVAGTAHDGVANRFALARYTVDGTLDPGFGVGGKVTTSFFGFDDGAAALAIQPDGRIVVVGHAYPGGANDQFALARYNPDGSLDPGFGSAGKVTTDFFGANDAATAVILQPGGRIVAAGMAYPSGSGIDQYALARYLADGTPDPSFSGDGKATATFSSAYARRLAAAGQDDGKIVAASWGVDGATGFDVFSVARFAGDGELDPGFGVGGRVTTSILGSQNQALAVAIQADGRILAAGSAFDTAASHGRFALTRYQSGAGVPSVALSALAVSPANVVGGTPATGTVTLSAAAPAGGAQVSLTDNSPAAGVPAGVTIPAGATTATFGITTSAVTAATVATLTATYNAVSRTATLTVNPAAAPPALSTLAVNPANVAGGSPATGTVTLTAAAPAGGIQVALADNSAATAVPGSVTIAAGAASVSFPITTGAVGVSTTATMTAAYAGVTRAATLTVTPPSASAILSVTATGRSGNNILSSPAGINVRVGTSGSASFPSGSAITLSVSNGRDAIWSGACSSGGRKARTCTFTLAANASVTASVL